MTRAIQSGTPEGFNAFCDWLTSKGLMTGAAVEPLRSATKQVLNAVEPDKTDLDLREIDADNYMDRFANLAGDKYSPNSLRAYRSRFNRSIELYRQYLEQGATGFKPPPGRASRRRPAPASDDHGEARTQPPKRSGPSHASASPPTSALIDYPFPLASGTIAHLYLPARLDRLDAERMAAYLRALVLEPQQQLDAGEPEPTA